jgi:hypothetical protein
MGHSGWRTSVEIDLEEEDEEDEEDEEADTAYELERGWSMRPVVALASPEPCSAPAPAPAVEALASRRDAFPVGDNNDEEDEEDEAEEDAAAAAWAKGSEELADARAAYVRLAAAHTATAQALPAFFTPMPVPVPVHSAGASAADGGRGLARAGPASPLSPPGRPDRSPYAHPAHRQVNPSPTLPHPSYFIKPSPVCPPPCLLLLFTYQAAAERQRLHGLHAAHALETRALHFPAPGHDDEAAEEEEEEAGGGVRSPDAGRFFDAMLSLPLAPAGPALAAASAALRRRLTLATSPVPANNGPRTDATHRTAPPAVAAAASAAAEVLAELLQQEEICLCTLQLAALEHDHLMREVRLAARAAGACTATSDGINEFSLAITSSLVCSPPPSCSSILPTPTNPK